MLPVLRVSSRHFGYTSRPSQASTYRTWGCRYAVRAGDPRKQSASALHRGRGPRRRATMQHSLDVSRELPSASHTLEDVSLLEAATKETNCTSRSTPGSRLNTTRMRLTQEKYSVHAHCSHSTGTHATNSRQQAPEGSRRCCTVLQLRNRLRFCFILFYFFYR